MVARGERTRERGKRGTRVSRGFEDALIRLGAPTDGRHGRDPRMDGRAWPDSAMASASCREVRERPGRWVGPDTVQVGPGAKRGAFYFLLCLLFCLFTSIAKILDHQTTFVK